MPGAFYSLRQGGYDMPIICATLRNKKLRYREELSASIVLSWCTLWHFSAEKSIDG